MTQFKELSLIGSSGLTGSHRQGVEVKMFLRDRLTSCWFWSFHEINWLMVIKRNAFLQCWCFLNVYLYHAVLWLQILNALTCDVLEHQGSFRTPSDQIQHITQTLKDSEYVCQSLNFVLSLCLISCVLKWKPVVAGPDLHVYLLIHNIDGLMLRGEKTQSALGQLASLPNLHLVASIDHINGPLGGCF